MFIVTMWILLQRRKEGRTNYGMVVATSTLITLATGEMTVNLVRICQGFINIGPHLPGGPEQYFADFSQLTFLAKSVLYNIQTLILDAVVIYRTYIVWQTPWAVVLPILGWFGLLAASLGINISLGTASQHASDNIFAVDVGKWITATYALTLSTNLLSSSLLAFKIWHISRRSAQYRSRNILTPALRAVIESGALYSVAITCALVLFVVESPAVYVLLDMLSPIISIVFNLIIITVGMAFDKHGTGAVIGNAGSTYPGSPGTTRDYAYGRNRMSAELKQPHGYPMQSLAVEITRYQETFEDKEEGGSSPQSIRNSYYSKKAFDNRM